jgi:beta-lactamase class A
VSDHTVWRSILLLVWLIPAAIAQASDSNAAALTEIQRHAEALDLVIGLSAVHLESGATLELNAAERFPLASTYKVPMAAYALHLVGEGKLALDELIEVHQSDLVTSSPITRLFPHPGIRLSLLNLMEATLIQSDNTATDVLLRTIGGGSAVTGWLSEQGIEDLRVDRSTAELLRDYMGLSAPPDGTSAATQFMTADFESLTEADWTARYQDLLDDPRDQGSPKAMVSLLRGIWQDAWLDAAHGEALRAIMGRCLTGGSRLSGMLPAQQLPLAHKTGTLGGTVNDVGVMLLPNGQGTVIIAVFTRGGSTLNVEAGERAIAETGRTVYDYFLFSDHRNEGAGR